MATASKLTQPVQGEPRALPPPLQRVLIPLAGTIFVPLAFLAIVRGTPVEAQAGNTADDGGGLVTIESDRQQADNRTGIVTATGNVRITYPERGMVATSRQAQYFSREGRLVLSGDVDVVDAEGQSIQAERLVYRLDSERLQAEPPEGEQVRSRLRIQPRPTAPAAPPAAPPQP